MALQAESYWCDFFGVRCLTSAAASDSILYRPIIEIALPEISSLYGSIPSEIGFLTKLKYLNMDRNSIRNGIPFSITLCTDLTYLSLSKNYLTGTTQYDLATMTSLFHLNLSLNSLSRGIPPYIGLRSGLTALSFALLLCCRHHSIRNYLVDKFENIVS